MKFFIGLSLPDPISSYISKMRGSLPSILWSDPDSYHIALCCIDEINNYNLIDDLDLALQKITFSSFELTIQGVDHFVSPQHQNYFWACVSPSDHLLRLKNKIEYILYQLDIKFKKERFIPRINLAKGMGVTPEQTENWLYKYNLFKVEPFTIHQFSLFSYYPSLDHPHYTIESNYLLR